MKADHKKLIELNHLLNDTLQQSDKQQLIDCIRVLGTTIASLKIKYQVNEEQFPEDVKNLVSDVEQNEEELSDEVSEILSKSIVECATAIAVVRKS
jgi:hypothetical protein